jgi:hypothetical protein
VRCERFGSDEREAYELDREFFELLIRIPLVDAEQLIVAHWRHLKGSRLFVQLCLYLATPATVPLAAERLAEAAEPAPLLRFIANRYGVKQGGHPGVVREQQLLVLEPFVSLLDRHDLEKLAEACNMAGWFETRKRLFERHLTSRYHSWFVQDPRETFDEHVVRDNQWIHIEIERALATGVTWSAFLGAMRVWLRERRSLQALELVARALVERGGRGDVDALEVFPEMDQDRARAIVTDATFAVQRRSLD